MVGLGGADDRRVDYRVCSTQAIATVAMDKRRRSRLT
jgi:hypothetical protein